MTDTGDFGVKMNITPKFVASRTLKQAEWNATIIEGDVATAVTRLKEEPGQDLLIYGSGTLVDELTRHGLIDEYRLMVYPVIVGTGKRLFSGLTNGFTTTNLSFASTTTTGTGVLVVTYTTARPPG
jgi:dihydrofolate reductase